MAEVCWVQGFQNPTKEEHKDTTESDFVRSIARCSCRGNKHWKLLVNLQEAEHVGLQVGETLLQCFAFVWLRDLHILQPTGKPRVKVSERREQGGAASRLLVTSELFYFLLYHTG